MPTPPPVSFAPAVNYGVGGSDAYGITSGDFNQDGITDLAVSSMDGNVSILMGQAGGTFAAAVNYSGIYGMRAITSGDFNRDGIIDLATADLDAGSVSVFMGRAGGTFSSVVSYPVNDNWPHELAIGDFNKDGVIDLVSATANNGGVAVLLGKKDGTFAAPVHYKAGDWTYGVTVGDFNQDGMTDIAAANDGSNDISIFMGQSAGTFAAEVRYAAGIDLHVDIRAADLNRDGMLDLIAGAVWYTNQIVVLMGQEGGVFAAPATYTVGNSPVHTQVNDFNQDGVIDLAVANGSDNNVSILVGNGDGTFSSSVNYAVGTTPQVMLTGDFNQDGVNDLAVVNTNSNDISVLVGIGSGSTLDLALSDDTGSSNSDNITNKTSFTLTGNGESGAKVVLFDGSSNKGTATVTTAGSWSLKLSGLSQGSHSFTTKPLIDGQLGEASAALVVTIDTSAPAVPTGMQSDTSGGGGLLVRGNCVGGATVTLFKDSNNNGKIDAGESLATTSVTGTSWAVGDLSLPVGTHAIKAMQTSLAGNVSKASAALTVVVRPENRPPSVGDVSRIGNEEAIVTLAANSFSSQFSDPDGDALARISVISLPGNGILQLNGEDVVLDQEISASELASLIYRPNGNWYGDDSFSWKGSDGRLYADNPATMTLTIHPVNDVPTLIGFGKSGQNDGHIAFSRDDFTGQWSDADGDDLARIKITSLASSSLGTLKLNGNAVTSNQEIMASNLDELVFVPAEGSSGNTSFSVQASDGRAWSNSVAVSLTVTADPTKPLVTVTNLKDQSTVNSLLTIQGTASASSQGSTIKSVGLQIFDQTSGNYMVRETDGNWLDVGTSDGWVVATDRSSSGSWQSWYLGTPANSGVWTSGHSYLVTIKTEDMAGHVATRTVNFGYGNRVFSQITLDKTLYTTDEGASRSVPISGQLSLVSGGAWDFSDQKVQLRLTKPGDGSFTDFEVTTQGEEGRFSVDVPGSSFRASGDYGVKVSYASNSPLVVKSSQAEADVLVGAPVGYAIIVQGEAFANGEPEGLLAHKRATNQIYTTLRQRGFTDENINYLNFDDSNIKALGQKFSSMDQIAGDHRDLPGARDGQPSRDNLQQAIEVWARDKLLGNPAPLYLVMVDHGKSEIFSMGQYDSVTSADLARWLTNLDNHLKGQGDAGARALAQPQVAMLGFCNSGSFIDDLSRPGRVVISSATAKELSYRNPENRGKNSGIEHGELFLDHLFQSLATGKTLYDSFNSATAATENSLVVRGNQNNAAANTADDRTIQKINDNSGQHPLLNDDGNKIGSNELSTTAGQDGALAAGLKLGITLSNSSTNSLTHPVQIGAVAPMAVLTANSSTLLWLQEDDPAVKNGGEAWVTILKPDFSAPGSSGNNLQISFNLPTMPMRYNDTARRWELNSSEINSVNFTTPGRYQVQYSVRDADSGLLATPVVGSLYRGKSGNQAPQSFALRQPLSSATIVNTIGPFDWDNSSDPEGKAVTYTLTIARDASFSQVVCRQEGLQRSHAVINFRQLPTEVAEGDYYWRVEAVDNYGATTPSSGIGQFSLDFPNDIPAILDSYLYSNSDHTLIADATVTLNGTPVSMGRDGSLLMTLSTQGGLLKIIKSGYRTKEIILGAAEAGSVNQLSIGLDRIAAAVAAPTGLDLATADDSGKSTSDNITKVTKALTLSGAGKKGAVVTLLDGDAVLGTVAVSSSGKWSTDVALPEGIHTIRATQKLVNDVSDASTALMITVDSSAPDAPSQPDLIDADDNGPDNSNNITSVTKGLNFSGNGEVGAMVTLFNDKNKNGKQDSSEKALTTAVVKDDGSWRTADLTLAIGSYNLRTFQTDLAGNIGAMSDTLGLSIVKASATKRAEWLHGSLTLP
ncbi:MAG: VCBS repeat-containing protein [Magnetococcales bacterium]|nr:VCBS repeat-containing protein [Magnetococcales bacterium]